MVVPLVATACPACGGAVRPAEADRVTVTDLPPRLWPVRPLPQAGARRASGRGPRSTRGYRRSAGTVADGGGALAALRGGVPVRKLPVVLAMLIGIRTSQDALRRATGAVVQTALLMIFTTIRTIFRIRARHLNVEVRELTRGDYAGVPHVVRKQKCLAHLQRSLSEALADQWGRARSFPSRLRALLVAAIPDEELTADTFAAVRQRLQTALSEHLRPRRLIIGRNRRLLSELGWQHDQGNLLWFLEDPQRERTNNRAERALHPAAVVRKVSSAQPRQRSEARLIETLVIVSVPSPVPIVTDFQRSILWAARPAIRCVQLANQVCPRICCSRRNACCSRH